MIRTFSAIVAFAALLSATTFENVSTAELSRRAERVCAVKCESCKPEKDPQSGLVFTRISKCIVHFYYSFGSKSISHFRSVNCNLRNPIHFLIDDIFIISGFFPVKVHL